LDILKKRTKPSLLTLNRGMMLDCADVYSTLYHCHGNWF